MPSFKIKAKQEIKTENYIFTQAQIVFVKMVPLRAFFRADLRPSE